ncbi:unnamed protein product [Rotaria sp. Silwood1]|nr:unnamed protein product [Rotaria sp. Silwood1]
MMNNLQFRGLLLRLQERLSDNDRKRLHFFFGNDIPRSIRDNPTLSGTLSLLESLLDQEKINEQDFTYLIKAFDEIRCIDAANLLRKHMKEMQSNGQNKLSQNLASIMPTIVDQYLQGQEEEDKYNVQCHLVNQTINSTENNKLIDNQNTNINPVTVIVNPPTRSFSISRRKKRLISSSTIRKCSLLLIMLTTIAFGIMTGVYINAIHYNGQLTKELELKNKRIIEEQAINNQTIGRLNEELKEFKIDQGTALIRAGFKFGGVGGSHFDDSLTPNFTCSHYLSGIIFQNDPVPLNWIQFLYSSLLDPQNVIEAKLHGTRYKTDSVQQFLLDKDEKISKIQMKIDNITLYINKIQHSVPIIRGLRVFTTKGRVSQSIDRVNGQSATESFDGYAVGYVTGKDGLLIDQLQFYWYRITSG